MMSAICAVFSRLDRGSNSAGIEMVQLPGMPRFSTVSMFARADRGAETVEHHRIGAFEPSRSPRGTARLAIGRAPHSSMLFV
jgi:hypothetical protein